MPLFPVHPSKLLFYPSLEPEDTDQIISDLNPAVTLSDIVTAWPLKL